MSFRYHAPLDPDCPEVDHFYQFSLNDPITVWASIGEELTDDFEAKHRGKCERCMEYGTANIEVVGP